MLEKMANYDYWNNEFSWTNHYSFNFETYEEENWMESSLQYLNHDSQNEDISKDFISKKRINKDYSNLFKLENKNKYGPEPIPYPLDNILEILKNNFNEKKYQIIIQNINFKIAYPRDLYLSEENKQMTYKDYKNELIEKNKKASSGDEEGNKKRGRKPKKQNNCNYHDKMSSDNIIKKIKAKLFEYAIIFLNGLLNKIITQNIYKLFKLDYDKYINTLKKDNDLGFLNKSLKNLFSGKISFKYLKKVGIVKGEENEDNEEIKKFRNHNCESIKNIFKNNINDTLLFVFNMTFRDWIDIFTLKKSVNEILNKYKLNNKNIKLPEIEESLIRVDKLLEEIINKNKSQDYLTLFILYLYNYERWFYKKKSRIKKDKNNTNLKEK